MTAETPRQEPPSPGDLRAGVELLSEILAAEQVAALLRSTVSTGFAEATVASASPAAIARSIGLDVERAALACGILRDLSFLEEDGDRYRASPAFRALLHHGAPQSLGNSLDLSAAYSRALLLATEPSASTAIPAEEDRLAIATGVWGLPTSPVARASFEDVDRRMPEVRDRWVAGAKHLELGCGAGRDLLRIAVAYPATRVVGVDLDALALASVEQQALDLGIEDRVRTVLADAATFSDAAPFDTVLWSQMFFPQSTRMAAIATISRMLTPGGHLVVPLVPQATASASPATFRSVQLRMARLLWAAWGLPWADEEEIVAELGSAGFAFVRTVPHPRTPYVLLRAPGNAG